MEIELEHVSFEYNEKTPVLHDINIKLNEPGLVCIIGPNGVGKSTLVKCINRLHKPTEGTVKINGKNIEEMTSKEISMTIGYVPPKSYDCFSMPLIDAILIGRHNHQKWKTTAKDLILVKKAMETLDLEQFAMRSFNELSAGQQQKVALARGLVQETEIMILDEPTANLDVRHQVYVTQFLRALADKEKKLIIMICHDLNIAARYASKVIVMAPPGKIECIGTSQEVITAEVIRKIYGIDCEVISYENRPNVILKSTFAGE